MAVKLKAFICNKKWCLPSTVIEILHNLHMATLSKRVLSQLMHYLESNTWICINIFGGKRRNKGKLESYISQHVCTLYLQQAPLSV